MNAYEIPILVSKINEIVELSRENPKSKYSRILHGDYMKVFLQAIREVEKKTINLTPTNALVYSETKRSNTDYLTITAYCNDCKRVNKINPNKFGKYQIKILKNPSLLQTTIACIQHNDHYHDMIKLPVPATVPASVQTQDSSSNQIIEINKIEYKSTQIIGEERSIVAQEIMNKHFGSARRYRLHLLSQNIKNVPEEEVFRKILSEYNSKDQMAIDWYQNLISTAATYQSYM